MINLKLQTIAKYISDNDFILDVGCDHALLDIYVVENKKNVHAIASDISANALKQASSNILKQQLNDKITVFLGDGLAGITEQTNVIVIAGMGGILITNLLMKQASLLKNIKRIILAPNNETYLVRKTLSKLGFYIKEEEVVYDKNIFYEIIVFEKGKKKYRQKELLYGPINLKNNQPLFKRYLNFKIITINNIIQKLPEYKIMTRLKFRKELFLLNKLYKKN